MSFALHIRAQGGGIEGVLLEEDTGSQRVGVVGREDRDGGLAEDRAFVHHLGDEVDGAAVQAGAGGDGACVSVQAWEGRQDARVDVQHPSLPGRHEIWGEKAHVAGEADQFDAAFEKGGLDGALVGFAVAAEGPVVDGEGWQAGLAGDGQTAGFRFVADQRCYFSGKPGVRVAARRAAKLLPLPLAMTPMRRRFIPSQPIIPASRAASRCGPARPTRRPFP